MSEKVNSSVEEIDVIREEISKSAISFVEDPENIDKILLIKSSQGTGKTITVLKTLLSRDDTLFVFLGYGHKQLKGTLQNSEISKYDLFHLKGRSQIDEGGTKFCSNPMYPTLKNYNVGIKSLLCNHINCEEFGACPYLQQYGELKSNPHSWAGVHSHLSISFTKEFLNVEREDFPNRCLIIDENPLSSLISKIDFTEDDLKKLEDVVYETYGIIKEDPKTKKYKEGFSNFFDTIEEIISIMDYILSETDFRGIRGIEFVNKFVEDLDEDEIDEMERRLNKNLSFTFIKHYKSALYNRFERGDKEKFAKDILEVVLEIAKKCIHYSKSPPSCDINLSFYSEIITRIVKGEVFKRKHIVNVIAKRGLPNVPVVILDATGDAEFYQEIFGREVIEYFPSSSNKRNIIQITDGMYYSKSLFINRNRVYDTVHLLVKHHHENEDGMINIITHKKFATIEDEKEKYRGMSIERYLKNKKIDMNKVRIWHYGDVKGKNDMQNDKILILVGTPEPNMHSFPKEVGCWYEGEEKINTERIPEPENSHFKHPYRYKDKRYFAHIRHKREHEIEQDIERLRFVLAKEEKIVYLFSKLPISFETKERTIIAIRNILFLGLLEEEEIGCIPSIIVLDALDKGRGKVSHKTLSNKTRNMVAVKKVGFPKIIQELLDKKVIECSEGRETRHKKTGRVYQFTDNGKIWYKDMRGKLRDFI